ncbi:MFS transporter [Ophiobolus disseminans]|uniref:MFS transporter n=1 Tax=Ophiobolus disseminans TaxID=1469910 RepID=A0A6A7AAC7_9PLEO|nr:MFS transporter [Ophiobolus disseminans]
MPLRPARQTPVRENWKCILMCLAMSLANCQYGYDTATIAGFQAMTGFLEVYGYRDGKAKSGWNIATTPQQLLSSSLNIGTILSIFLTHPFSLRFGRRPAIWLASIISSVAAGVQVGSSTLTGLYFGRILIGISNGFFITFANVYVAEAAPAHLRGPLVSAFGVWVSVGGMLGAVVNERAKEYAGKLAYRIPLASLYAVPVLLSCFVFFVPESPRWLLMRGREAEAKIALGRLRGRSFEGREGALEEEFVEMKHGIREDMEVGRGSSLGDMFKGVERRRTVLCCAVILSHSSSGVWLTIGYATFFFQAAGVNRPFLATILKSFMGLCGVLLGITLSYRTLGRRSLMLTGHAGAALFMLGMAIAQSVTPGSTAGGKAILACALMYQFTYTGFSNALSWPIANELVSSRLRVITIGTGTGINYIFAWLISFTTPYFINSKELNWGAKVGYIWAASNAITFVFFYFFLPEMHGRSLEEVDELFQNGVPTGEFAKYHCTSGERAREQASKDAKLIEENKNGDDGDDAKLKQKELVV